MGVTVEWVRCGADAVSALHAHVSAAKAGDPLAPVTVVVPSNHVGVATRRTLASGALGPVASRGVGLAAVSFVTVYRLAELLGASRLAANGRRPVSTPVLAAALRAALHGDPGVFEPVAQHAATESALLAAYRELREVSPVGLQALAGTSCRAADVVRLHQLARARLEPSWYDEQDLMLAAIDAVTSERLDPVVVYLPQRLSRHACLLLQAVARVTPVAVLAGATGDPAADDEVTASLRRLDPTAPEAPVAAPLDVVDARRTRIVTTSDADDETRAAVRAVVDAVRAGTPLDRIALLHASPDPYARLAHEHLAAAGIATNGPAVVPLAGRVAGRTLLGLLALPERQFRRQDMFAWLASAPAPWGPVGVWERLSREAGVVAGRGDWDQRLGALAADLDARVKSLDADDDSNGSAEYLHREAERTRGLREFVLTLIDDLADAAAEPRPWSEHARWSRRRLREVLGGADRRRDWPEPEVKAADRVEAAITRLAALDGVEGPITLDVFARTLTLELEADLGRVGRFGEGVLVGPVGMGVGIGLDLVVVLGLAEGTFPAGVRDDSLLPDHERAAAGDELPARAGRVEREHRQLLSVLGGAHRHVLAVPRGDLRRSAERVPSRWVLDIASALAGERWWGEDLARANVGWVEHVASFDAGVGSLDAPATEQEHRLRALMATVDSAGGLAAATDDPALAAAATVVAARRSPQFTRFDGNLAGLAVPSPVATATSTTRLERWATCPFHYFVQDVLGVDAVENPEDSLQIQPIEWGNLVHLALEQFLLEVLTRAPADQPAPHEPWTAADRARLTEIGDQWCAQFEAHGLTGRPLFWRRDRAKIHADLQRFLIEDDARRREHRIRPAAAELAFGLRGAAVAAVPFALPDGRQLLFRGKADRLDVADDGSLHIVDYKTGKADRYRDLTEDEPDQRGRRLQLGVYGLAARHARGEPAAGVRADYWFVSTKGQFKRVGYTVTDAVLERLGATLATIIAGIEAGVFPAHPTALSTSPFVECWACDPDGLGVAELRRAWERKRTDPVLAGYAALAADNGQGDDVDDE